MTQETIISIAMWIAAFALLVILVVVACCAIWFVIRTAWEYISPSDKPTPKMHYDEKDGCWVLDECVKVNDITTFYAGKGGVYINYSKKKNEE